MPEATQNTKVHTDSELTNLLAREAIDVHKIQLEFIASTGYNCQDDPRNVSLCGLPRWREARTSTVRSAIKEVYHVT